MEEFVMLTDTHLGRKNHNQFWSDLTESLFDEIIDFCNEKDIYNVVHFGDFFDSRKTLNVLTLNKGIDICRKFEENMINLFIILGNHDQFYKNQPLPHSLSYLDLFKYINVIDTEPKQFSDFIMVPWGYDINQLPERSNLMGHFEINGIITNAHGNEHSGSKLNISDFKKFNKVWSGHFHTPSKNNNIEYIGSTFAMDFNDVNSTRGYYVVEGLNKEFIEFKTAPKFIDIKSDQEYNSDNIKGNIIRFTFVEDYGNVKNDQIIQNLMSFEPQELHIDYNIVTDDEIVMDQDNFNVSDNKDVLREYIGKKELPNHINKEILVKFVDKLEKEM